MGAYVIAGHIGRTVPATDHGFELVATCRVREDHGRFVHGPFVAPGAQCVQDQPQLSAGRGEVVFESRGSFAVPPPLDHSGRLQGTQPASDAVARRSGVRRDRLEAVVAEGYLSDNQECPFLPDELQRGGDRAGAAGQRPAGSPRGSVGGRGGGIHLTRLIYQTHLV
jgi:hypothetical protein